MTNKEFFVKKWSSWWALQKNQYELTSAFEKELDNYFTEKPINIDAKSLRNIAMFLEGIKQGKGNIIPLGTNDLDELWKAIEYFNKK